MVHAIALGFLAATASAVKITNSQTSLNFLYQNNLNFSDAANHVGAIQLDAMTYSNGLAACTGLYETLLSKSTIQAHKVDFAAQLSYIANSGYVSSPDQAYFIDNGVVVATEGSKNFKFVSLNQYATSKLPVLCTQSAPGLSGLDSTAATNSEFTVKGGGNTYTGYRNQKSFRFLGIRYAENPGRFNYSSTYTANGLTVDATKYGSQCLQYGSGSEDCFYLNIFTPYIPKQGSKANLRPVHFWIHGGGFTGGVGSDPTFDGGNLASREDIVTVTINYRLSTLGFLAVPGTNVTGNYGIGDQISALKWVVENIATFGGDPNQITLNGQSAGAGSVRALLGSLPAIGKYQGAMAMSNLGGGVDFGFSNYGTTYSTYYTIAQSFAMAGEAIFTQAGCTQNTVAAQVACLTTYNGDLTSFGTVARYVVQDGTIVNTPELPLTKKSKNTAHVPVMFGNAKDDGASFIRYSQTCADEVTCISYNTYAYYTYVDSLIASGLFPLPNTGNISHDSFNVSARIGTDNTFRCVDEATVYAGTVSNAFESAYYYQSNRGYAVSSYNPNGVDVTGPISAQYPYGNPNKPYYVVHSGDLASVFGNLYQPRDASDIYAIQLTMSYFASFYRSGQPNPSQPLLKLRGYTDVLSAVKKTGPWGAVRGDNGPINQLDYPARLTDFIDEPQCTYLNYTLAYYLQGGV